MRDEETPRGELSRRVWPRKKVSPRRRSMMEFWSRMSGRVTKGLLAVVAGAIAAAACRPAELDRRDAEKRMLTAVAASQAAGATPPPAADADPPREAEAPS